MKLQDVDREGQALPASAAPAAAKWRVRYQEPPVAKNDAGGNAARLHCPDCGERLIRISRRLLDRLTSLFSPVQRYQCRSPRCQWRGNLPAQPLAGD